MRKQIRYYLLILLIISTYSEAKQNDEWKSVALIHVTVIDATGAPPQHGMTVVITGPRITDIAPDGSVQLPQNIHAVDASGKFLIPGLWDMHAHLEDGAFFFPLFIANGVTSLRDMGVPEKVFENLKQLRHQIENGQLLGPRFLTPGPVLDGPRSFPAGEHMFLTTEREARDAVRWHKRNGSDFIKVHQFPSRDVYFAIADETKKQGLTFVGHLPTFVTMTEAISAGQKSFEHNIGISLACSSHEAEIRSRLFEALKKKKDDWTAVVRADVDASESYDSQKAMELFSSLKKNSVSICPTLVTMRASSIPLSEYLKNAMFKYYPNSTKKGVIEEFQPASKEEEAMQLNAMQRFFSFSLKLTGEMQRQGVQILNGTDTPLVTPGFSVHDELELLVKAGLTPMEALQAATINPAKLLGLIDSLGTVEKGKIADLVLLDANPLQDIRNTRRIHAVMINGRLLERKALDKLLAQVESAASKSKN
jgi:imidazolonepropionase-like amidohydrolase